MIKLSNKFRLDVYSSSFSINIFNPYISNSVAFNLELIAEDQNWFLLLCTLSCRHL